MSVNDIKKYKTILIENQIASGGKISKFEANYTDHSNSKENQCRYCNHFHNPSVRLCLFLLMSVHKHQRVEL